ncbi:MAG: metallophosphoesterase family protein [Candidatus Latescibacteria bacterium]|nr:metallophosphoesterase family protein [Candidatus Latescibacterota bacterium]
MRIAIISDIHGNLVALEAVLNDLKTEHIDRIVCLGDVVSGGPQPGEVIAHLKTLNAPVVMGNMDTWCLNPQPGEGNSKNAKLGDEVQLWGVRKLSPEDLDYMRTFQATVDIPLDATTSFLCFHGSPHSNEDVIVSTTPDEEMERMLSGCRAMVFAGGHTHTQMIRYHADSTIVNPGSVGAPIHAYERIRRVTQRPLSDLPDRQYPPWAEYGVVAWENRSLRIELHRVPIDIDLLLKKTHESGMPHADWWLCSRYGDLLK